MFSKLMDVIAAFLRQRAISVFPCLDDWLIKNLIRDRLVTIQSLGFLPNLKKSDRFPAQKFTFIGMEFLTKFSQSSNGSCTEPISDNQETSVIQTCIGTNFPFSYGQTQCCSRLCSPRQTALTSSSDVPFVCLETSYSSSRSSNLDKRYDSISLTMVDKPYSVRDRDSYPSSRSNFFL